MKLIMMKIYRKYLKVLIGHKKNAVSGTAFQTFVDPKLKVKDNTNIIKIINLQKVFLTCYKYFL